MVMRIVCSRDAPGRRPASQPSLAAFATDARVTRVDLDLHHLFEGAPRVARRCTQAT